MSLILYAAKIFTIAVITGLLAGLTIGVIDRMTGEQL